jgi:superfamily II DNA/RNA helicase
MITALSEALAERGFDTLTPVQEAVTAPELADADLLVSAQTGSGKTVGFGMAIAHTLMGDDAQFGPAAAPLALVVAPTRELALQVMRELGWLYARTGAVVTSCVGGMDSRQERRVLERGVHIVVGTPGRLCDHINRGALDLSGLRAVVLDEADEMLDLGFREDLEFILSEAPAERRTLLFSATVSPMIAKLAQAYQRDAQRVNTLSKTQQHTDISYQALRVAESDSENAIFNLLRYHDAQSAIVFANTRASVAHLSARLTNRGIQTVTLSGELSQTERSHALQAMRDGRARVCVATDVAARGIDLPSLELVIHADLPSNGETLLHRSGRTGRAGRKGISALIVPPKIVGKAERLLKWAKLTAEWTTAPSAEDVWRKDEERLLSDPEWNTPLSAEQEEFAAKLLAQYAPEQIAAGYLRLYQARNARPKICCPPMPSPPNPDSRNSGQASGWPCPSGRMSRQRRAGCCRFCAVPVAWSAARLARFACKPAKHSWKSAKMMWHLSLRVWVRVRCWKKISLCARWTRRLNLRWVRAGAGMGGATRLRALIAPAAMAPVLMGRAPNPPMPPLAPSPNPHAPRVPKGAAMTSPGKSPIRARNQPIRQTSGAKSQAMIPMPRAPRRGPSRPITRMRRGPLHARNRLIKAMNAATSPPITPMHRARQSLPTRPGPATSRASNPMRRARSGARIGASGQRENPSRASPPRAPVQSLTAPNPRPPRAAMRAIPLPALRPPVQRHPRASRAQRRHRAQNRLASRGSSLRAKAAAPRPAARNPETQAQAACPMVG